MEKNYQTLKNPASNTLTISKLYLKITKKGNLKLIVIFVLLSAMYSTGCKKEDVQPDADYVDITIQNHSVREPIAVCITDGCWITLYPNKTYTFYDVNPIEFCQLVGFSQHQSLSSFNIINNGYIAGCINDQKAKPPYDLLVSFEFDSRRKVVEENENPSILILADEAPQRISNPNQRVDSTSTSIIFTVKN